MRIVIDTNVLIAAFLKASSSREVLEFVIRKRMCILSPFILEEFRRVLLSEKFKFPKQVIEVSIRYLEHNAEIVSEESKFDIDFSDPNDQKILALCHTVDANFLITGDHELIALGKIGKTTIILPAQFWKSIS